MRKRSKKEDSAMEAAEGTRLVNSKIPPPCPLYSFWIKDNGLQRGARIANGSPPTVKKRRKFTALTIQRYLTVKMTRSCVASEYSARSNYVLRKADESISKRRTRKEDYGKP
jgi:hypothetical protein